MIGRLHFEFIIGNLAFLSVGPPLTLCDALDLCALETGVLVWKKIATFGDRKVHITATLNFGTRHSSQGCLLRINDLINVIKA